MNNLVFITGANGFIGNAIHEYFSKSDYRSIGIVKSKGKNSNLEYEICDLIIYSALRNLLKKYLPKYIFHCAGSAEVSKSFKEPLLDYESNVTTIQFLFSAIVEIADYSPVVVYLSSASVYGDPKSLPIIENMNYNPLSPYALHKAMGEQVCNYYKTKENIDVRIARIFSAYGPGLKKQIFWDMYKNYLNDGFLSMFGDGSESRDYIYIDDLVSALKLIMFCDLEKNKYIFNVANGIEMKISEIAEIFADKIKLNKEKIFFNCEIIKGSPKNWRADISLLKSIDYFQKVSINDGIEKYINWIMETEHEHNKNI
jgi:nucleoside-diphosphate-sugar epimerase